MEDSILKTIRKLSGLSEDDTSFDEDLLDHINAVLLVLIQLGVDIEDDFELNDESSTWEDLLGDDCDKGMFRAIKTYIGLKVRKVFDPPQNGTVMEGINSSINELEWRINVQVDPKKSEEE